MSREIYTYTDLTKLSESKAFQAVRQFPQVTVSADLRKALKGTESIDRVQGILSREDTFVAVEFHRLAQAIDKNWNSDQIKFNAIILLSGFMREKLEAAKDDEKKKNWLIGCYRNIGLMHSAITMLEQANVKPEDLITNGDRNLELMVEAWKMLYEQDPSLRSFRAKMDALTTKASWEQVFMDSFGKTGIDTIVFHGFYFITPLQERIMRLLETAGIRLVYLFPYDTRYPFAYEIWRQTYSEKNGYPPMEQWHMDKTEQPNAYGEIFEGRKTSISNRLEIREYASTMEFVDDVKHITEKGYALYSTDYKTANRILKDYFPEMYGERKILSYPIGQFVSVLNQMWDEERQTVVLDKDHLIECFSSGWLAWEGASAKQYMQDLLYILPYFAGCSTIEEWEERIDRLKEVSETVIAPFLQDQDADESISRWQSIMGNPLGQFSMFSVPKEKLDVILALIRQLLEMGRDLFGKNDVIHIQQHLHTLDRILRRHEISNELYEEERNIVSDIFERLGTEGLITEKCAPADIARALNLFINGRFEEGEIQTNRIGLVVPMYFVDAAIIKNKGKVHVCMCDVDSMPGGNKAYIWPLTGKLIHEVLERTKNPLIENMIAVMELGSLCNRYFMYCALKNKDVIVSWVSNMGEKLRAPSPYIKLVCDATGVSLTPAKRNLITYKRVTETADASPKICAYEFDHMPEGTIKEARMDYALCPMKYVLSYVCENRPAYQSDFQQNYAVNALISAIYHLMADDGMTVDEVYKNVMELFPGLRKIERRQVFDYISYDENIQDFEYGKRTKGGENYYTDERLKICFPNREVREAVIGQYGKLMTPDGRRGLDLYETVETRDACTFCPHTDYCRNAVFATDRESYYD